MENRCSEERNIKEQDTPTEKMGIHRRQECVSFVTPRMIITSDSINTVSVFWSVVQLMKYTLSISQKGKILNGKGRVKEDFTRRDEAMKNDHLSKESIRQKQMHTAVKMNLVN